MPAKTASIEIRLRDFALAYPEVTEEAPWGHRAMKVRGKTFVFLSTNEGTFSLSTRLPVSRDEALRFAFCEPTHYGLGKAGWVSATFTAAQKPPVAMLEAWIDESYRAIAPKKLVATLPPSKAK